MHVLALPLLVPAGGVRCCTPRACAAEALQAELRYAFSLSSAACSAFEDLAGGAAAAGVPAVATAGRFKLLAHDALSSALKQARAPLDAAAVAVRDDGSLTAELDLLVGGAVVGLRLAGSLSAAPDAAPLRLVFDSFEWFEPSEEFGVSRQIAMARERLDGALEGLKPYEAAIEVAFASDALLLCRDTRLGGARLVLQRAGDSCREADEAMAAALARAAEGKRGTMAFDGEGRYLGDSS